MNLHQFSQLQNRKRRRNQNSGQLHAHWNWSLVWALVELVSLIFIILFKKIFLNKGKGKIFHKIFSWNAERERAVYGLSVQQCMTTLPAFYSGGCWCECACMKEELRLSVDLWFVNFTGALGESWGHTPPATALGNYALLKCKWVPCTCVSVCVCACIAVWVDVYTCRFVCASMHVCGCACPLNLSWKHLNPLAPRCSSSQIQ